MTFLDVVMENWWSLILASLFLVIGIFLLIVINSKKYSDAQRLADSQTNDNPQVKQQAKGESVANSNQTNDKVSEGTKNEATADKSEDVLFDEQSHVVEEQEVADTKKEEALFAESKSSTSKTGIPKMPTKKPATTKNATKKSGGTKKIGDKKMESHNEEVTENYRLTYDKVEKNWVLKKDGAKKATKRFKTKEEATEYAKNISEKHDANLAVHKKDGKFQKKSNI